MEFVYHTYHMAMTCWQKIKSNNKFIIKITKIQLKNVSAHRTNSSVQVKVTATDTSYVHVLMKSVNSFTPKIFSHEIHQSDVS